MLGRELTQIGLEMGDELTAAQQSALHARALAKELGLPERLVEQHRAADRSDLIAWITRAFLTGARSLGCTKYKILDSILNIDRFDV